MAVNENSCSVKGPPTFYDRSLAANNPTLPTFSYKHHSNAMAFLDLFAAGTVHSYCCY